MSGDSPPVRTEQETLVVYLARQRAALKDAAYGLTEEQLMAAAGGWPETDWVKPWRRQSVLA